MKSISFMMKLYLRIGFTQQQNSSSVGLLTQFGCQHEDIEEISAPTQKEIAHKIEKGIHIHELLSY